MRLAAKRGLRIAERGGAEHHLEWLVKYQVLGDSYQRIADDTEFDRKTVTYAIKQLTEYFDLPERARSRPGRPHKAKN